jgi:two-component system, NtrC family, sensor kinase
MMILPLILIVLGAGTMGFAIQHAQEIIRLLRGEAAVRSWQGLVLLMSVFLLGYCWAIGLILMQAWIPLAYLTSLVFCLGAGFVLLTVSITRVSLKQLLETRISQQQYQVAQAETQQALIELKQAQTQLIQSEKMAGLAQLVAGLAHEINNPLTFAMGNLAHLEHYGQDLLDIVNSYDRYHPQPHPAVAELIATKDVPFLQVDLPKLCTSMGHGLDRIEQIIHTFKEFSHLGESAHQTIDFQVALDRTLLILAPRLQRQGSLAAIAVTKHYGNPPRIHCHATAINQVFMHLLNNAIDVLRSSNRPVPTITLTTEHCVARQVLIVRIHDNGPGINPTIHNRIFEPFFTTKPVGQGTGLGLAMSYQIIVGQHQGQLMAQSRPNDGTEFVITVPLVTRLN